MYIQVSTTLFILSVIIVWFCLHYDEQNAQKSGQEGEQVVSKILKDMGFTVFDDVLFNIGGRSVQVDHIALSGHGVYIVETKNHHGNIEGSVYDKVWYQTIYGKTYTFYNPVWQNYGHIRAVCSLLGLAKDQVKGVVVFASNPGLFLNKGRDLIVTANELSVLGEDFGVRLSEQQMSELGCRIRELNQNGRKAMKNHIKQLEKSNIFVKRERIL